MTEKEKWMKVIKGLKHELQNRGKCGHYCRDGKETVSCEYDKDGLCIQHWGNDALALLKAQEPRVMTLEEVVSAAGTPAWFEGRSKRAYTGWVLVYDVQEGMGITGTRVGVTKPGHITIWPATELYGAKWRCWTSRPTDEQREAIPWN